MSTMLEQAIIDAEALKEAALKNAESVVIEKYAEEIKEAVNSLLEQDELEDELVDAEEAEDELPEPYSSIPMMTVDGTEFCPCPDEGGKVDLPMSIDLDELSKEVEEAEEDMGQELAESLQEEKKDKDKEKELKDLKRKLGKAYAGQGKERRPVRARFEEDIEEASDPETADAGVVYQYDAEGNRVNEGHMKSLMGVMDILADPQYAGESLTDIAAMAPELREVPFAEIEKAYEMLADKRAEDARRNRMSMSPEELEALADEGREESERQMEEEVDIDSLLEKITLNYEIVPHGQTGGRTSGEAKYQEELAKALETIETLEGEREKKLQENNDYKQALLYLKKKNEELEAKQEKHIKAVLELKESLDKVNLLNAKLIYTNRVLESNSLNERQKDKIVEAISKSTKVEEAKMIFETLQNAVGTATKKKVPKSLSEAIQRKSSLVLSQARQEKPSTQDPVADRWKKLAGIDNK